MLPAGQEGTAKEKSSRRESVRFHDGKKKKDARGGQTAFSTEAISGGTGLWTNSRRVIQAPGKKRKGKTKEEEMIYRAIRQIRGTTLTKKTANSVLLARERQVRAGKSESTYHSLLRRHYLLHQRRGEEKSGEKGGKRPTDLLV